MPELEVMDRSKVDIVPVEFWVDYKPIIDKPGEFKPVEWVKWAKRGSPGHETVEAIPRVKKSPQLWATIEPYYNHWLKGQETPVDGTPLAAWPGITRGQVQALNLLLIRSVEDLAAANDATQQRIGMGARELVGRAKIFMEAKKGSAVIEAALAIEREKVGALVSEVAELRALVESLTPPERRGPGRPPKVRTDEAA